MSPFGVVCAKCGAGMPAGVAFCGSCGARIPEVPSAARADSKNARADSREEEPAPPPGGEASAPGNAGVRILLVAWALGIVAGFFLGYAFAPGTPAGEEAANVGGAPVSEGQGSPAGPTAETPPESAPDLLAAARAASDAGRYSEARDLYRRALKMDPGDLSAHVDLGVAELALGEEAAARASFGAALSGGSPHPAAAYNLAKLAEEAGNRVEAGKYYTLYLKLAPEGPHAGEVRSKLASQGASR